MVLLGNISKLYRIHGTNIIKAITSGNKIVQQKDINWSKRIRGKDALAQININIIIQNFILNITPLNIPSNNGSNKTLSFSAIKKERFSGVNGLDNDIFCTGSNNMKKE